MSFFEGIVLGFLQGVFEWLPVSSQGQVMAVAAGFFGFDPKAALGYSVLLHAGTLLAAVIFFRKEIFEFAQGKNAKTRNFILIAVGATALTAIPAYFFLKVFLQSSFLLLALIGLMLFVTGFIQKTRAKSSSAELSLKNSLLLGFAQGFSVLPGVSRSGVTTAALLFEGFSPRQAFWMSFLLSIPSVFLAEIFFGLIEGFVIDGTALVALVFSFVFGLLSINVLLRVAEKINFTLFCYAIGFFYLALAFLGI